MEKLDEADPIWGQPANVYRTGPLSRLVQSERSGSFTAPEGFSNHIQNWSPAERAKLATWILNKNLGGEQPTITPQDVREIEATRSLSMSEKFDRFLLMLDHEGFRPGDPLPWGLSTMTPERQKSINRTMLWIEAASDREFYAFSDILAEAGIIEKDERRTRLAYEGYRRIDDLRRGNVDSHQAFVAMWFNRTVDEAYRDGIALAVRASGYRPQRIDNKEHNNKIDDEIIAEIRRSRFIIADFTSERDHPRGGVYFEAGFAAGLGIPVIWTCRADLIDQVHFDTRQFNHIVWETPSELREKLTARIRATIGQGLLPVR